MTTAKAILRMEAALKLLRSKQKEESRDSKVKKAWLKMIKTIDNPWTCDALIIEFEARKKQLNADKDFKSEYVG